MFLIHLYISLQYCFYLFPTYPIKLSFKSFDINYKETCANRAKTCLLMKNNKTYDLNAVIITKRAHTSSAITIFIITVILLLWPFIASCTTMKNYYSQASGFFYMKEYTTTSLLFIDYLFINLIA